MRSELVELIRCPLCSAEDALSVREGLRDEREIRDGEVVCGKCGGEFPISAGILDALPTAKIREEVTLEVNGWDTAYEPWFDLSGKKNNFWLAESENQETEGITSDEYLRRLPDYNRIGKVFDQRSGYQTESYKELMAGFEVNPNWTVLDLGAARCWTTRDFARKGCRCVAIDIVTTKYIGLGSSDVYFDETPGLFWERMRCDMEELPFRDRTFDLIFCNAVLHHTKDLHKVLCELNRILRPGGKILIVNEPDYGLFDKAKRRQDQMGEASHGVNENLYSNRDLTRYLKRAGFTSNLYSPIWNIKYHAWLAKNLYTRMGLKRGADGLQMLCERAMIRFQPLVRIFMGLGTMGVATKVEDVKY